MKPFRILYATGYNGARRCDMVIEARTQMEARFAFSELYPRMRFKQAIYKKPPMKSPITGKPMPKKTLYSYLLVEGQSLGYKQEYYYCEKSRSRFTDPELDRRNYRSMRKAAMEGHSRLKAQEARCPSKLPPL